MPVVGETVGALGFVTLTRLVLLTSEVADRACTPYDVVEDPEGTVFALVGVLFEVKRLTSAAPVRQSLANSGVSVLDTPRSKGCTDVITPTASHSLAAILFALVMT
jgi:hypothetical protein